MENDTPVFSNLILGYYFTFSNVIYNLNVQPGTVLKARQMFSFLEWQPCQFSFLSMLTTQDKYNLCCQRVARASGNLAQGVNLRESGKVV